MSGADAERAATPLGMACKTPGTEATTAADVAVAEP